MYGCPACGAVVEVDPALVSTRCAYCTAPLVDTQRTATAIDAIVPFRLSKRAALERLRAHIGDRWWTPEPIRALARSNRLQTAEIQGVLVPFFAYDATVQADYRARIGVHWVRTRTVQKTARVPKPDKAGETIHIEPERSATRTETQRETEWFDLRGSMGTQFDDHLVCASAGLVPTSAHDLLPFDLGRAATFDSRLMLGWTAELPSRTRRDVDQDARSTLADLARDHLRRKHLTGDAHRVQALEMDVELHRVRLLLLPVWLTTVRLGASTIQLAINGQTGRCAGRVPTSKAKVALVAAASVLAVLIVLTVLRTRGVIAWT